MTAKIEKSPHTCKRLKEKLINRNKMALPIARDRPGFSLFHDKRRRGIRFLNYVTKKTISEKMKKNY